ncbi:hypothetical protein LXA43DRAFT_1117586 [Ganoderma leucocontextum]|nr:hypothetical protein LXA43DRAFT_1117586 [Ganoderma leucocontextum]
MGRVLIKFNPRRVSTIAGGYMRGRPDSDDVDVVFTHSDAPRVRDSASSSYGGFMNADSLEKALTVFTLPPSSLFHNGAARRRLELIFTPPKIYSTTVLEWTASTMFQPDIRRWTKDKLWLKLDSLGITRRYDSKDFYPKTEKEVFGLFGPEWIDPTSRDATL